MTSQESEFGGILHMGDKNLYVAKCQEHFSTWRYLAFLASAIVNNFFIVDIFSLISFFPLNLSGHFWYTMAKHGTDGEG